MQIVGASLVGEETVYNVGKPTGAASAKYLVNTPVAIPASSPGAGTDQYPTDAAYITQAVPAGGMEWGPVNNSWLLSPSGKGFLILGGAANGVVRVAAKAGTSAGDDFPLIKIVNASGLVRQFGNIVGYGAPVDPPPASLNRIPTFQSVPPGAGKPFAVLLNDVASGDTADAAPLGVVNVQINYTDAAHTHAVAITNDYVKLASAADGALILWRELGHVAGGGTLGVQWARVRLDPVAMIDDPWGVVYSTITAASGPRDGPITPGTGLVRLYLPPTGPIGTPWQPGPNIPCETSMYDASTVYKIVIIRKSRIAPDGSTIYRAISQGCKEQPSG
jgi:hypothetical protein